MSKQKQWTLLRRRVYPDLKEDNGFGYYHAWIDPEGIVRHIRRGHHLIGYHAPEELPEFIGQPKEVLGAGWQRCYQHMQQEEIAKFWLIP